MFATAIKTTMFAASALAAGPWSAGPGTAPGAPASGGHAGLPALPGLPGLPGLPELSARPTEGRPPPPRIPDGDDAAPEDARGGWLEVVGYGDAGCGAGTSAERTIVPFREAGVPADASCADANTLLLAQVFFIAEFGCSDPLTAATIGSDDWCCRMTRDFPAPGIRSGAIVGCFDAENPVTAARAKEVGGPAADLADIVHPPHAVHPPHRGVEGVEASEPDRSRGIAVIGFENAACDRAAGRQQRTVLPFAGLGLPDDASCADPSTMAAAEAFVASEFGCDLAEGPGDARCCRMTRNFPADGVASGAIVGCFDAANPNTAAGDEGTEPDGAGIITVGNPYADGESTVVLRGRVVDLAAAEAKVAAAVGSALDTVIPRLATALRDLILAGVTGDRSAVVAEEGFGY